MNVLKDISLSVNRGEFVSVTGKSGCGKSTLLYILSTMDTDYEGDLWIDGDLMHGKTEANSPIFGIKKSALSFSSTTC